MSNNDFIIENMDLSHIHLAVYIKLRGGALHSKALHGKAHQGEALQSSRAWSSTVHRGAFCQFPFRWIYYCHSSKSTGKETGKKHLCAVESYTHKS